MKVATIILLLIFQLGCSLAPKEKRFDPMARTPNKADVRKQKVLIEQLEKDKMALEMQNSILLKALKTRRAQVKNLPQGQVVEQFPQFEELILDQASTAHEVKDEERLKEAIRILSANQPRSKHLEKMYLWLAEVQESKQLNSQALVTYDVFIRNYPNSKHIPQALFLKGQIYEKLNLRGQALNVYSEIRRVYPNSNERLFAESRLKSLSDSAPPKKSKTQKGKVL